MKCRRRKGSTLSLVVCCMFVIIVIGAACFVLIKILGGGRELANATDASTLKMARDELVSVTVPAVVNGLDFSDCIYPTTANGISLLTYNRCVAKALMIAINASEIGGSAPSNASQWITAVNVIGQSLDAKLQAEEASLFGGIENSTRMLGNNPVNYTGGDHSYMKPGGATNIYFPASIFVNNSGQLVPSPSFIPFSNGTIVPQNNTFVVPGTVTRYMAGYEPITVPGVTGTMYGAPVFPQQQPHLVSLYDFQNGKGTNHGSAPSNAFKATTSCLVSESHNLGGAVAAGIVGAINSTIGAGGGGASSGAPFGSGFEYTAALSYGYIEFENMPANPKPPGYNPDDYSSNIFNNELLTGPMQASGNASNNSDVVIFSNSPNGTVNAWLTWAQQQGAAPPYPAGSIYVGLRGQNLNPPVSSSNPPTAAQIAQLKQISTGNTDDCIQQLYTTTGLMGSCVGSITAMEATFGHKLPSYASPNPSPNFSQTDWAKATVIQAFESPGPNNAGNNSVNVNLTATSISGLGVFIDGSQAFPVAQNPNPMAVPSPYALPLEGPGTIYDLIRAVQTSGCLAETVNQITQRCQQIQPKTSAGQVLSLLKGTQLPMAPYGSTSPNKMYIYLPGGSLSASLVCNAGPPPKYSGKSPDGASPSSSCYQNTFNLDGLLVDAPNDQGVHLQPYVQMNPPDADGLTATDYATWWPGSGAQNIMGQMLFQEVGIGDVVFSHIN